MLWKTFNRFGVNKDLRDDENYLVCWKDSDGNYSLPHKAYYRESENKFFGLENYSSHPLYVDIYMEIPSVVGIVSEFRLEEKEPSNEKNLVDQDFLLAYLQKIINEIKQMQERQIRY